MFATRLDCVAFHGTSVAIIRVVRPARLHWWHNNVASFVETTPWCILSFRKIDRNGGATASVSPRWLIAGLHPRSSLRLETFSTRPTKLAVILPESQDCSCYVSRPILTLPALRLQKHNDLCTHDFDQSRDLWRYSGFANVACAWSWKLCGINLVILQYTFWFFPS